MEIVTLREFARRLGVSLTAVQKGAKPENGRIEAIRDENGKITGIDWDTQSVAWEANCKAPQRRAKNQAGGRPRLDGQPVATPRKPAASVTTPPPPPKDGGLTSLADIQRARELVKLQIDNLKLKEQQGELVSRAEQEKIGYEVASGLISDLYNLPERLSDELAGMSDPNAIHALMTKEIDNMVRQIRSKLGAD